MKGKEKKERRPRPEPRLLTIEDVAHMLGISARTIRNRLEKGARRPFPIKAKRLGRLIRFEPADVEAYVASLEERVS
jgi:excisionase family DNA binding protein